MAGAGGGEAWSGIPHPMRCEGVNRSERGIEAGESARYNPKTSDIVHQPTEPTPERTT